MLVRRVAQLATLAALALAASADAATAGGAEFATASGGAAYGATPVPRPVASRFGVAPRQLRADRAPRIVLLVEQPGNREVRARLTFRARKGRGTTIAVPLGTLRTGREIRPSWPKGTRLAPGTYRVLLHVTDPAGQVLQRERGRRGTASLTVVAPPKPKPVAPVVPVTPVRPDGVFPVQGPHTYGDGIGAARDGHTHQGVDIAAAEGTPIVAPTAGTIAHVDYQPCCAGRYIVMNAADGRAFFFAHCRTNSIAVTPGQPVAAGASLCGVGTTGASSGPHLHFEIWVGGWRVDKNSRFIDPLPQLKAWDR
ncbi:MAG TPA: M23 family metallopeptidase [Solirubrobacteraceae bacterium]